MIDRMQNYYGIAIRGSKGDIVNMKKSITRHGYTALHRRQISGTFIAPQGRQAGLVTNVRRQQEKRLSSLVLDCL